jgi:hypothetical protein
VQGIETLVLVVLVGSKEVRQMLPLALFKLPKVRPLKQPMIRDDKLRHLVCQGVFLLWNQVDHNGYPTLQAELKKLTR